jgi:hypothetical protein
MDVVDRARIRARIHGIARIGTAPSGAMTRPASDRVIARELLLPKENLAEHALRLGDRILRRHGHGRQLRMGSEADEDLSREYE